MLVSLVGFCLGGGVLRHFFFVFIIFIYLFIFSQWICISWVLWNVCVFLCIVCLAFPLKFATSTYPTSEGQKIFWSRGSGSRKAAAARRSRSPYGNPGQSWFFADMVLSAASIFWLRSDFCRDVWNFHKTHKKKILSINTFLWPPPNMIVPHSLPWYEQRCPDNTTYKY